VDTSRLQHLLIPSGQRDHNLESAPVTSNLPDSSLIEESSTVMAGANCRKVYPLVWVLWDCHSIATMFASPAPAPSGIRADMFIEKLPSPAYGEETTVRCYSQLRTVKHLLSLVSRPMYTPCASLTVALYDCDPWGWFLVLVINGVAIARNGSLGTHPAAKCPPCNAGFV